MTTAKNSSSYSNTADGKLPPHDADEEFALLGAILNDPRRLFDVRLLLEEGEVLYKLPYQDIYRAMISVTDKGETLRPLTLMRELKSQAKEDLLREYPIDRMQSEGFRVGVELLSTAQYLRELYIKRLAIQQSSEITKMAYANEPVKAIVDKTRQLSDMASGKLTSAKSKTIKVITQSVLSGIEAASKHVSGLVGVNTGLGKLNRLTGGWQNDDFIVIAGRPGMAKTAVGLYHIYHSAVNGVPAGWISGEMSEDGNVMRLISMRCAIPYNELRRGRHENGNDFTADEWKAIHEAAGYIEQLPIHFHSEPAADINDMTYLCLDWQQRYEVGLVGFDYLQIMTDRTVRSGDEQAVNSSVSKKMKALNQRMQRPVMALAQLNRAVESQNRPNKRPKLSDLRMTGQIEQDADIVEGLFRGDYYKMEQAKDHAAKGGPFVMPQLDNKLEIEFLKNRNGPLKVADVWIDVKTNRMADEAPLSDEENQLLGVKYGSNFPSGAARSFAEPIHAQFRSDDPEKTETPF